jgi:hypothetical protein
MAADRVSPPSAMTDRKEHGGRKKMRVARRENMATRQNRGEAERLVF